MRLTKRQLKRIIREEYNKLQRRKPINEMYGGGQNFDREIDEVSMMIDACQKAGMTITKEQEKRFFEAAYYMGNVDPELVRMYEKCQK